MDCSSTETIGALMKKNILPETGFIRLSTVLNLIPVSKSTWWNGVESGQFPKPIKIGARIVAWKVEDIQKLIKTLSVLSHDNFK